MIPEEMYYITRKCFWKEVDSLTAVTIGKFDGFHLGHQKLLKELKKYPGEAVVCKIDFPGQGLLLAKEQEELLDSFGVRRLVRLPFTSDFAARSPEDFVRGLLVDTLDARDVVVGVDFRFGVHRSGTVETLRSLGKKYGFNVHPVEKLSMDGSPVSSTRIRTCYEAGDMEGARKLLGYPVEFRGTVRHGRELGRTIGFPTANLIPEQEKLLPGFGVYASTVTIQGSDTVYRGITNIGCRPTVNEGSDTTIETYIPGFSGDLYGREITVRPDSFIRGEKKFQHVEELVRQMQKDVHFLDFT